MKVKMRSLSAGPNGVFEPGSVVEVSHKEAKELIRGGFATPVKSTEVRKAVAPPPQDAAMGSAEVEAGGDHA